MSTKTAGGPKKNMRRDDNEEPIGGRWGLIGHNSRSCAKQGVARWPKDWIDTEPEEQIQGNVAGVETVVENVATEVQQENVAIDNGPATVVENVATEVQQENVATENGLVTDAVSRQYDFIQNMDRFETYWYNLRTNLMNFVII